MREINVDDLDIVFISYDEPLKEQHWLHLVAQNPFVKRVNGVTGFDAAHKRAAEIATTDRFITIDGDTTVDPRFFDMILRYDDALYGNHVFSWASTNEVNGLVYGNGSIKCWPRDLVLRMNTHEHASDERAKIEFCWSVSYLSMRDSYSTTHPAATPYHAFRAGFREGVKMGLADGHRVPANQIFDRIWKGNAQRLLAWCSVGADHENGLWAIFGARMGLHMLTNPSWDHNLISDYQWFQEFWDTTITPMQEVGQHDRVCTVSNMGWNYDWLYERIIHLGQQLAATTGRYISLFDAGQSRLVKQLVPSMPTTTQKVLFEFGET